MDTKLKNKLKADKRKAREKAKKEGASKVGADIDSTDDNENDGFHIGGISDGIVKNESKDSSSATTAFGGYRGISLPKGVEIEYVSQDMDSILNSSIDDPALRDQFKEIFSKFAKLEEMVSSTSSSAMGEEKSNADVATKETAVEVSSSSAMDISKLSNRKKKILTRLTVAELKTLVPRPDVVEAHDVTASNPKLLVYLKSYRNTVPVPRHWCAKRKYLQGKRGIEKPPFKLPEFIADTGISKIRDSLLEREALKSSKQKARDRLQVKNGKLDIDYQVLHDAFFKYQTIPKLTIFGDLYYEGKEFEKVSKGYVPGVLSDALREALGIGDSPLTPVPWLTNMQRYGPPPSYPSLRIPGLNAPLPPGASYGFHIGGWGKPPVDEYGQPLYGDVFGTHGGASDSMVSLSDQALGVDKKALFGQMNQLITEEEDEDIDENDGDEDAPTVIKNYNVSGISGLETPSISGITSVNYAGLETPNVVDIRKRLGSETPEPFVAKELYTVLGEKTISGSSASQFFKSDKAYFIPGMESANPEADLISSSTTSLFKHDDELGGTASVIKDRGDEGSKRKRLEEVSTSKKLKDFKF